MKITCRLLLLVLPLATPIAFADNVPSNTFTKTSQTIHNTMSAQQTNDMLLLMEVMRSNITQMSDLMETHRALDKVHLAQAARVMQSMSDNMQELSLRMKRGRLDASSVTTISGNNQRMIDMIKKLQTLLDTTRQ